MSLAPLPTLDDLKVSCHIDLSDTSVDGELAALMAAAESIVQQKTGVPVADTVYVELDDTTQSQPTATFSSPMSLLLARRPVALLPYPVVSGFDGTLVDPTTYRLDPLSGILYGNPGTYFGQGPYTITYHAGLVNHPEWATKYRAIASLVIRNIVAWLFDSPNPALKTVGAGGGVTQSFDTSGLPPRICTLLSALPGAGAAIGV